MKLRQPVHICLPTCCLLLQLTRLSLGCCSWPWAFPSFSVTPCKATSLAVAALSSVTPASCVGIVRLRDGLRDRYPVEDYLDLFDLAAHQIHQGLQANSAKEHSKMNRIIIGMAPWSSCGAPLLPWAWPSFAECFRDTCPHLWSMHSPPVCHSYPSVKCSHHLHSFCKAEM